eukprot:GEMP01070106.1.p1 GENE.GEMP01070106.1~~GEMP01070106.1.p1  ORF type:complete len:251 (+),score=37.36 GEMP01070106.1:47-754(+)
MATNMSRRGRFCVSTVFCLAAAVMATTEDIPEEQICKPTVAMVEEIPEDHTLHNKWGFWCKLPAMGSKDQSWQNSQQLIHEFSTVESFWRLFNNIQSPSSVAQQFDYSLFKHGIHPSWEDETVSQGGRWLARLDKMKPEKFDEAWLHLVLALIGESAGDLGHYICGVVVSCKGKSKKLALWIGTVEPEIVMGLAQLMYDILEDSSFTTEIHFEDFSADQGDGSKKFAHTFPPKAS